MTYSGQCLCGAIRYQLSGEPKAAALCHCRDCRRSAGAPMVAWAMFPEAALAVTKGQPKTINSSGTAMRSFCADCGTGLFYRNAVILPGIVDVQSSTLDDPEVLPHDNEAAVKAADVRLGETEQALLFDPQTGYLNTQGQA
ncbi:MAG: GFA family protein, partial [Burkholderiales bacterium]